MQADPFARPHSPETAGTVEPQARFVFGEDSGLQRPQSGSLGLGDELLQERAPHPEAAQLIDLRGPKMEMLYDFPTYLEPHYAQMIRSEKLKPIRVYPLDENHKPYAIKRAEDARIERKGNRVDVYMLVVRTHFTPDIIRVNQGDDVYFHVTNLEQDDDIAHGFGINWSNCNMQIEPGETKTMRWKAEKAGITPFYCSNFCSALHQEMQGYLEVRPRGTPLASTQRPSAENLAAVLDVNTNTVLRALRLLRDEGLLEFRRGRGISVAGTPERGAVVQKARELVELARHHGYRLDELIEIIEDVG